MKVEKTIIKPSWTHTRRRSTYNDQLTKYGFELLEIGDLLTVEKEEQTCAWDSFYQLAMKNARRFGFKFKCREADNGDFQVYREA